MKQFDHTLTARPIVRTSKRILLHPAGPVIVGGAETREAVGKVTYQQAASRLSLGNGSLVSSQLNYWDCIGTRSNNEPPTRSASEKEEEEKTSELTHEWAIQVPT